jgi:ribosomal protein S18 acetylase RimI-like enzyme
MKNIEIKKLNSKDLGQFKALIFLFENVFEMKDLVIPDDEHLMNLLNDKNFFVFVAISENNVVGGLTSYTLEQYYSKRPLVYIYDLAVKTEFQRRGIGKLLIFAIKDYCMQMGMEEMFVQADEADYHALEFYRGTEGNPEKVVHFNYPLNR